MREIRILLTQGMFTDGAFALVPRAHTPRSVESFVATAPGGLWSADPFGTVAPPRRDDRVVTAGVGYAAHLSVGMRRVTDRLATAAPAGAAGRACFITANVDKQPQDQLHLMSRRDPRSWRPPA
jgi:hypothetical protein